jgi:hypothetical protein
MSVIVLACLYAGGAFCQEAGVEKGVMYDPIFWKDDLKLKTEQCSEIKAVNFEFYERILDTYEETANDRKALDQAIVECSNHRSQQIWEIFSPKQRRKWTKLWSERYSRDDG